jgi:hypothetical protein
MAEDMSGMFKLIVAVSRVLRSTALGRTREWPG